MLEKKRERSPRPDVGLVRRYGKIGISAVDAAARYAPGREAPGIRTTQARDFARSSRPRRTERGKVVDARKRPAHT
jgi:hypothetical protein